MWLKEITPGFYVVIAVSLICFARILNAAINIRRGENETSRKLSTALFGTCIEIALATVAVVMEKSNEWLLIRTAGRVIEWGYWEWFNWWLKGKRR